MSAPFATPAQQARLAAILEHRKFQGSSGRARARGITARLPGLDEARAEQVLASLQGEIDAAADWLATCQANWARQDAAAPIPNS